MPVSFARLRRFALSAIVGAGFFAAGWSAHQLRLPAPVFCDAVTCALLVERLTAITDSIGAAADRPRYLAIGDSLIQGAQLPVLCGRVGINAGVAGATTTTFLARTGGLARATRPDFVVVGLGTNDALRFEKDGFRDRVGTILRALADYPVLILPVSQGSSVPDHKWFNAALAEAGRPLASAVPPGHTVADGVHFDPEGSALWTSALTRAAKALPSLANACDS